MDEQAIDWAALTPRARDCLVAEHVMGYQRVIDDTADYAGTRHGNAILLPPGETLRSVQEWLPRRGAIPFAYFVAEQYTQSHTAARAVEQAVMRRMPPVDDTYCAALESLTKFSYRDYEDHGAIALWPVISATPEQRCRAALIAVGVLTSEE